MSLSCAEIVTTGREEPVGPGLRAGLSWVLEDLGWSGALGRVTCPGCLSPWPPSSPRGFGGAPIRPMSVKYFEVSPAKHLQDAFYEHGQESPARVGVSGMWGPSSLSHLPDSAAGTKSSLPGTVAGRRQVGKGLRAALTSGESPARPGVPSSPQAPPPTHLAPERSKSR